MSIYTWIIYAQDLCDIATGEWHELTQSLTRKDARLAVARIKAAKGLGYRVKIVHEPSRALFNNGILTVFENSKDRILNAIDELERTGVLYDATRSLQRDIISVAKIGAALVDR